MPPIAPDRVVFTPTVVTVAAPVRLIALSILVLPVMAKVAALNDKVPAPRLESEATLRVPAFTVVVPV